MPASTISTRPPAFTTINNEDERGQLIIVQAGWDDGDADVEEKILGPRDQWLPPEIVSEAEENLKRVLRLRRADRIAARLEEKSQPQETVHK